MPGIGLALLPADETSAASVTAVPATQEATMMSRAEDRPAEASPPSTSGVATPDAGSEHASEAPAILMLRQRGFGLAFNAHDGLLLLAGSDRHFRPEDVKIRDYYRFEGTSDPDDMSVVYALEAQDGTRGILVDAFGPYADPAVAAVLDRMRIQKPDETAHGLARVRPIGWLVGALGLAFLITGVWVAARAGSDSRINR
jgi:hypothetical protein